MIYLLMTFSFIGRIIFARYCAIPGVCVCVSWCLWYAVLLPTSQDHDNISIEGPRHIVNMSWAVFKYFLVHYNY